MLDRCVVFDLDDTLYLERDYARSGFAAVGFWAQARGIDGVSESCWELFCKGVRGSIFNDALAECGVAADRELVDAMVAVYRSHRPNLVLAPDAEPALTKLADAGVQLAMLTGGPIESQQAKITALNLQTRFHPLVLSGQWGVEYDKPNTRAFIELERLTGLSGSSLTYVADNPAKDGPPAAARGWRFDRIRRLQSLHETVASQSPVREFCDLGSWQRAFVNE